MEIGTVVALTEVVSTSMHEYGIGTTGIIVDAGRGQDEYGVALTVDDLADNIVGLVIAIDKEHVMEAYNPVKHAGYTTVEDVQIMGKKIYKGTMLKKALEEYNYMFAHAIKSACKFEELDQHTKYVYGYKHDDLYKMVNYETYENMRIILERQFAEQFGYYAQIHGHVTDRYTITRGDMVWVTNQKS